MSGTLLQGILFVGLSIALAVAGLVIVRHYVPLLELEANHVVGLGIFAVLGTIYAVLLSFVVIAAWEQFGQARQVAEQEAEHVANLYWLAQELPDPGRHQVQLAVRDYSQAVVTEEWPLMGRNDYNLSLQPDQAWVRHDAIWQALAQEPDSRLHSQLLDEMRGLDQDRRSRLLSAEPSVPTLMWVILLGGEILLLLFTYLFGTKRVVTQALMTIGLAGTVALILVLTYALATPYSGYLHIEPTGFESVLSFMNLQLGTT